MVEKLTRGQKIKRTNIARYGEGFYSRIGKKGGGNPLLQGIKNGTHRIVEIVPAK